VWNFGLILRGEGGGKGDGRQADFAQDDGLRT
jgi:hypothetical protein